MGLRTTRLSRSGFHAWNEKPVRCWIAGLVTRDDRGYAVYPPKQPGTLP